MGWAEMKGMKMQTSTEMKLEVAVKALEDIKSAQGCDLDLNPNRATIPEVLTLRRRAERGLDEMEAVPR